MRRRPPRPPPAAAAAAVAASGHATRQGARFGTRRRTPRRTRATDPRTAFRWFARPNPPHSQRFHHPPPQIRRPRHHQRFHLHAACCLGSSSLSRRRAHGRVTPSVLKREPNRTSHEIGFELGFASSQIFTKRVTYSSCPPRGGTHPFRRHARALGVSNVGHGHAHRDARPLVGRGCGRGWSERWEWGFGGGAGWAPPEQCR